MARSVKQHVGISVVCIITCTKKLAVDTELHLSPHVFSTSMRDIYCYQIVKVRFTSINLPDKHSG